MTVNEILTLISRIAFICCITCFIIYYILVARQIRRRHKAEEEREREYEALKNLRGDDYWKAYAAYKKKYQK